MTSLYPEGRISEHRIGMNISKSVLWCLWVLLPPVLVMGQEADGFRPGLDIDAAGEERLKQATAEVLRIIAREPPGYESVAARLVVTRRQAES